MTTYWQQQAEEHDGDMFLAILAQEEAAQNEPEKNYPYRDKFPDRILELADWFVETTKIKPNGHNYKGWIKAFDFAIDAQYTLEDLENAWLHSDEGNNFTVTSPFSLLGVAGERKARAERRQTKYDTSNWSEYIE